jgi:hypothetical protein
LRYSAALDTQWLSGTLRIAGGALEAPDLIVRHSQGGELRGRLAANFSPLSARFEFEGPDMRMALPGSREISARELSGSLLWEQGRELRIAARAQSGSFKLPQKSYRLEGGFRKVRIEYHLPPPGSDAMPKVLVRAQVHDFLFEHKIKVGFKQITGFFRGFRRKKGGGSAPSPARRSRPWDIDVEVEAAGTNNRVHTDIARISLVGDMRVQGVYPYTLVRGKFTGLQGEIGQRGQAYDLRDFEVKWENSTLEEGTIYVEGDKRILRECGKPELKQTCAIFIKLDGRLDEMNFSYDTDCGQDAGEPIAPTVLINSVTQGCYSADLQGGEGRYGEAALNFLEPRLSEITTRISKRLSFGLIQSTQVSGLGTLAGGENAGFDPVALEVQSKEKYRISLKAKAGYHPEKELSNPMEYRLAAEYRPPLERWVEDSVWKARIKNRFTVETAVETRPEVREDLVEERQIRQQAGLRYRYRFWDWW